MAADDARAEALLQMLLNVVQELWIVKDRQIVLEHLLEREGISAAKLLNDFQPDAALAKLLDAERRQLLEKCLGPADDTDTAK